MDITIIVPVYNRAHLVGATLDSIAAQTLRPIHLVLVDNNSQDNTLKVLLDFKKRHQSDDFKVTVLQETRRGAAAARNCGLQEATTEWVMFFDSDDIMAPDLLESYARAVEKHADAEMPRHLEPWLKDSCWVGLPCRLILVPADLPVGQSIRSVTCSIWITLSCATERLHPTDSR